MKKIEVKKPNIIDRIVFALTLPDIPSKNDLGREGPFKVIKTKNYNLMKNIIDGIPGYTTQIRNQNAEIKDLKEEINGLKEILEKTEKARRKNASSIGGLKTSLNLNKKKNKELLNELSDKEFELDLKNKEIEMLKNKGKRNKNLESYKNYFQARKELEKREKNDNS